MLQAILDTILDPEMEQIQNEDAETSTAMNDYQLEGIDDQTWLDSNLDMEFWTNLEDHPLLTWLDVPEDSHDDQTMRN